MLLSKQIKYIEEVIVNADKDQDGIIANVYLADEFTKDKNKEEIYKKCKSDIDAFNRRMPSYKHIKDINVFENPFKKNINKKIIRSELMKGY